MQTLRLSLELAATDRESDLAASPALQTAAAILRAGGTVAFATETVYGLGANALDPQAVAKIFAAKQRPAWDPLIVHIADQSMLAQVVSATPLAARLLIDRFWPGPLTLLMPRNPDLPAAVTAGQPRVGVRQPAHPVAAALIRAAGLPIAAPSANTFGHVSPTTAQHVAADLDGRIDAILDSGQTMHGLESTVLDACADQPGDPCILYRPGAITLEQLRSAWPSTELYADPLRASHTPASPGLGIRHYAPRARLILVESLEALLPGLTHARAQHSPVGVMLPDELALALPDTGVVIYPWGAWTDPPALAHRLFAGLRALDDLGVSVILCPLPRAEGIGLAIIDRLRKAARAE